MADRPYQGVIDFERVARYLRLLGVPNRLMLLQKLQLPHSSGEIRLPAVRARQGERADRVLSRQAVEEHLKKLEGAGLVRHRSNDDRGRTEWLVNEHRLFVLVDELRRLALIRSVDPDEGSITQVATHASVASGQAKRAGGPHVVLASGPYEGRVFLLEGPGPWTIGRTDSAHVGLPYDPYVSSYNTSVRTDGDAFWLRAEESSRNGTTHNWRLLNAGDEVDLRAGDTIGVGRSLLVFRGA